jgi:hypothetical protein
VNAQFSAVNWYSGVDLLQVNVALVGLDIPPNNAKLLGGIGQAVEIFVGVQIGPRLRKQIPGQAAGRNIRMDIGGNTVTEASAQRCG